MNDLTGANMLKGERTLFNAFKVLYFTCKMEVRKIKYFNQAFEKMLNNFDICGFIGVMIVVHNT
jgi:hypothetical protein